MTGLEFVFVLIAALTLFSAVMVVTTPNMVRAALWLILALFGVAGTFVLLNAAFLAVVQVVVYIGAIAVLMIFAIMLTRKVMKDSGPQTNSTWGLAALIAAALFGGLTFALTRSPAATLMAPDFSTVSDPVAELGRALVSPQAYVIPFEVASVLLLAAMIGAIYVAWKK
ncbi:MAG: NADH-quinone oxidoreductase subunit J [Anaerolineae bacterium]|nr:MAG: NADH-quinone oxidoreductase subunit J [Anaerolineae bacterium]